MTEECDHCGAAVSTSFHRVFADNDAVLHGCPSCLPNAASKHPEQITERQRGKYD